MSIFGSKKKTEKVEKVVAIRENKTHGTDHNRDVIVRPRITEKSGVMGESLNVYTFEVRKNATKSTVAKAVSLSYKVNPLKVRIINLPSKKVFVRGKFGEQSGVKKALVFLKKGEKIEFA